MAVHDGQTYVFLFLYSRNKIYNFFFLCNHNLEHWKCMTLCLYTRGKHPYMHISKIKI